jgi:hypothetical protein
MQTVIVIVVEIPYFVHYDETFMEILFCILPFQFGYIKRMEYIQEMTIITIRTWRLV